MGPEILEFLHEVGEVTDNAVGRGLATCIGAVAVVVTAGWRLLRRRKPDVESRVKVSVDAPAGERVSVQLGSDPE